MSALGLLLLGLRPALAELPAAWTLGDPLPSLESAHQASMQVPVGEAGTTTAVGQVVRPTMMEVNFRGRYLFLPDSVMDIWYFNSDDPGANPYQRPKIRAYLAGAEFVLKPAPTHWIFYVEYFSSNVEDGYWDDVEDPAEHEDGDWIVFDNFAMIAIGANYGHEVSVSNDEKPVWVSMIFGGGLGFGVVTGGLTQWHNGSNADNTDPECLPESAAYERKDSCPNDGEKRVPGVLPIVDISYSLKLNFADRANLRLDAGLHNLIYVGGALGGVF